LIPLFLEKRVLFDSHVVVVVAAAVVVVVVAAAVVIVIGFVETVL